MKVTCTQASKYSDRQKYEQKGRVGECERETKRDKERVKWVRLSFQLKLFKRAVCVDFVKRNLLSKHDTPSTHLFVSPSTTAFKHIKKKK